MGLWGIIQHFKIFDSEVKNTGWRPEQRQLRCTRRFSGQLFLNQIGMVEVQMHITALPDQLSCLIPANCGQHPSQQSRRESVKRKAEPQIA